jgi:hypothetical protein
LPDDDTEATPVEDTLELMTAASIANCRLGGRELMLVRLATLVALDAPAASYLVNIGPAADSGLTLEDAQDVLVAMAPIVGTARVASAVIRMSEALGIIIGLAADEELEGGER